VLATLAVLPAASTVGCSDCTGDYNCAGEGRLYILVPDDATEVTSLRVCSSTRCTERTFEDDEGAQPVQVVTVEEDRLGDWTDTREGPLEITLFDGSGSTLSEWTDTAKEQDGGCCADYWQVDEPAA
jgi:hypothetical protein